MTCNKRAFLIPLGFLFVGFGAFIVPHCGDPMQRILGEISIYLGGIMVAVPLWLILLEEFAGM